MRLPKFRTSLRVRIIGGIVMLVILVGGFVFIYFPARQASQAYRERQREAQQLAEVMSHSVATGLEFEDRESVEAALAGVKARKDLLNISVINSSGIDFYSYTSDENSKRWGEKRVLLIETPIFSGEVKIGNLKFTISLDDLVRQQTANRRTILLVSGLIIIIGFLFGLYLNRMVLRPILRVNAIVQKIAEGEGDLAQRLFVDQRDEIGEFSLGFNRFLDKLAQLIQQARISTEKVSVAADEISIVSKESASRAEKQAFTTNDVAISVQEMTAAIVESSQNATQSFKIAEQANLKAQEGTETMHATRKGMDEIVVATSKTGEIVKSLSERATQIGEVVQVIDDIADQTNLLALNAAIEAARAGEQGRGFAVVADEVRKLAERTTKATQKIADTINAIQKDTHEAAISMEEAHTVVKKGKVATEKTEQVLSEIIQSVTQAMEMVRQIATASEEMSSSAAEISKDVESINTVTKDSAGGAEKISGASEQLYEETEILRNLMARFKLRENARSAMEAVGEKKEIHKDDVGKEVLGRHSCVNTVTPEGQGNGLTGRSVAVPGSNRGWMGNTITHPS